MCGGWSINWVKTMLDPSSTPIHLAFLWDTSRKTIALLKDKNTWVEAWAKDLMALNKTIQENLECFVHFRNPQRSLLIALKKGPSSKGNLLADHTFSIRQLI